MRFVRAMPGRMSGAHFEFGCSSFDTVPQNPVGNSSSTTRNAALEAGQSVSTHVGPRGCPVQCSVHEANAGATLHSMSLGTGGAGGAGGPGGLAGGPFAS